MQVVKEKIEDSNETTKKQNDVDLEEHFKENGLSDQACSKIAHDVINGE